VQDFELAREELERHVHEDQYRLERAVEELKHAVDRPLERVERITANPLPWVFCALLFGIWLGRRATTTRDS